EPEERRLYGDDRGLQQHRQDFPGVFPVPEHHCALPRASPRAAQVSRVRIPTVMTAEIARYITSTMVKISTVRNVVWFICCALKARSEMVIRETSAVAFRSSMNRLPHGGIMAMNACGRMMRLSASLRGMLRATVASHWPRGTALTAPRTTSAP